MDYEQYKMKQEHNSKTEQNTKITPRYCFVKYTDLEYFLKLLDRLITGKYYWNTDNGKEPKYPEFVESPKKGLFIYYTFENNKIKLSLEKDIDIINYFYTNPFEFIEYCYNLTFEYYRRCDFNV